MPIFNSSQGKTVYTDTGLGATAVIFIHGLPTSKELWDPVLPHILPGYRLVTYDLLDYGESEKIGHMISHRQRAGVLDELRASLGLDSFILVAHDLGSSVAVDYMGKYGKHVEKLVLSSPPIYPDFPVPPIVKLTRIRGLGELVVWLGKDLMFDIGIKMGMVHKNNFTPALKQAMASAFDGPEGRQALLRCLRWGNPHDFYANYPVILRQITVPTLAIIGRKDPYIPLSHAERIPRDVPGAGLHVIENGAHFLPMDTPKEMAAAINLLLEM